MICAFADVFMLVGTSLAVYPAAGLIDYVPDETPKYLIDPKIPAIYSVKNLIKVEDKATVGVVKVAEMLLPSRP